ncbi:MAG TPA: inositol 2-dehydrogenase [Stellaceae bacterium]|nr:inositol 2-dehydrogenase [Stellaceae bacterium]
MISFCQFGAGRIGQIHASNIALHPRARLRTVVDVNPQAAQGLAERYGATVGDAATALADPGVDAVLIASSTDTHAALVEVAARAKKPVLCEKPLDLDRKRAEACLAVAAKAGISLMLGFNRRFDPNFSKLHKQLRDDRIGRLEMLTITSRDPGPPTLDYVKVSGGLFRDMMIHDFDMARWLLGEEPVQVMAAASALVDSAIGGVGDVDTAVVTLKTAAGTLCQITNSRRATYGYDQRIEALGSKGMLRANNVTESTLEFAGEGGVVTEKPLHFFLERYAAAYRHELDHFIETVEQKKSPMVGGADGVRALVLAEAALESSRTGRAVEV